MSLITLTPSGMYCDAAGIFVDPWAPVDRAVITHAHSDHALSGCRSYLAARRGASLLRARLGDEAAIETVDYGQTVQMGGVRISLHPAGHVLGSSQVRLEYGGEVTVVSGDFKVEPDPTCDPFELVRCHTLITESTFGLPVFRWPESAEVLEGIERWWKENRERRKASILFAYALGKSQRILIGLTASDQVFTHGAVERVNELYREEGVAVPKTQRVLDVPETTPWHQSLVIAPPGAASSPWMRRFGETSRAFASGWMRLRGTRRRRAVDRGFALSDHADWPSLMSVIRETGAEDIKVTHGYVSVVVRHLQGMGLRAEAWPSRFQGEVDDDPGQESSTT